MSCVPGSHSRGLTIIITLHAVDDDSVQNSVFKVIGVQFSRLSVKSDGVLMISSLVKGMNFQSRGE